MKNNNNRKIFAIFLAALIFLVNPVVSGLGRAFFGEEGIFENIALNSKKDIPFTPDDSDFVIFGSSLLKQAVIKELGLLNKDFRASVDDITYDEIKNIETLDLSHWNLEDITGIEYFKNLKTLNLKGNKFKTVNLFNNSSLENLDLSDNHISVYSLSSSNILKSLDLSNNDIVSIDVSAMVNLERLDISNNELTTIDLSKLTSLFNLNLNTNDIKVLDLSENISLIDVNISNNLIELIDVSKADNINSLNINDNRISSLSLGGKNKMSVLDASNNKLEFFDGTNYTSLTNLNLSSNRINGLDITGSNNITELYLSKNRIDSLDVSALNLSKFEVDHNQLINLNYGGKDLSSFLTYNNFLLDSQLFGGDTNISLIAKEKKLDIDETLEVLNSDFYVVYNKGKFDIKPDANPNIINVLDGPRSEELSINHKLVQVGDLLINHNNMIQDIESKEVSKAVGGAKKKYVLENIQEDIKLRGTSNYYIYTQYDGNLPLYSDPDKSHDNDIVPFLDDKFKQVVIGILGLIGKDPSASIGDITYKEVNRRSGFSIGNSDNPEYTEEIKKLSKETESAIGISYMTNLQTFYMLRETSFLDIDMSKNMKITEINFPASSLLEITLPEGGSISQVKVQGNLLKELDLSGNTDLNNLNLGFNSIEKLDISSMNKIDQIVVYSNPIISLDAKNQTELTSIHAYNTNLEYLDISGSEKLLVVYANSRTEEDIKDNVYREDENNKIREMILAPNYPQMTDFRASYNRIRNLNDSSMVNSKIIILEDNLLKQFNFKNFPKAENIRFKNNKIESANFSGIVNADTIDLNTNRLNDINVSDSTRLRAIYLKENNIKEIDLSKNTALINVNLSNNRIENLDVRSTRVNNTNGFSIRNNSIVTLDTAFGEVPELYKAYNFLKDSTGNQFRFISDNYRTNLKIGDTIDVRDALGYEQEIIKNKTQFTISDKMKLDVEIIEGPTDMFSSNENGVLKINRNGTVKIKATLKDADPSIKNGVAKTSNFLIISVENNEIILKDGNASENPETASPAEVKDIYGYRLNNFRDTGFEVFNQDGNSQPTLSNDINRKVYEILEDGSRGKSFDLPKYQPDENLDINRIAKDSLGNDYVVFGNYIIEYTLNSLAEPVERKIFIIDQIGDLNQNGRIDGDRDSSGNILDDSDIGIYMLYLGNIESIKAHFENVKHLADIDGNNIYTLNDANNIKYFISKTAGWDIVQKYTFLIK
ncbi:MAG: hypothetical protein KFW09_03505 [Oscillospiraceae bacterium]|nr:hypothetical protein [Oscillospiraceae bacterium]